MTQRDATRFATGFDTDTTDHVDYHDGLDPRKFLVTFPQGREKSETGQ